MSPRFYILVSGFNTKYRLYPDAHCTANIRDKPNDTAGMLLETLCVCSSIDYKFPVHHSIGVLRYGTEQPLDNDYTDKDYIDIEVVTAEEKKRDLKNKRILGTQYKWFTLIFLSQVRFYLKAAISAMDLGDMIVGIEEEFNENDINIHSAGRVISKFSHINQYVNNRIRRGNSFTSAVVAKNLMPSRGGNSMVPKNRKSTSIIATNTKQYPKKKGSRIKREEKASAFGIEQNQAVNYMLKRCKTG